MIATIAGVGIAAMPSLGCLLACLRVVEGRNHFLATYFDDCTQNEGVGTVSVWDGAIGREPVTCEGHRDLISCVSA